MGDNGRIRRYVVRVTPRKDCRCVVRSCPANRGGDGCTCDYAYFGTPCGHPKYRRQWHDRGASYPHLPDVTLDQMIVQSDQVEPESVRQSLTARVSAAQQTGQQITSEAARAKIEQLGLGLEA